MSTMFDLQDLREYLSFPKRGQQVGYAKGAIHPGNNISGRASFECVLMKRQCWAIEGSVCGIKTLYSDPIEGFSIVAGFRCMVCSKVFLATTLDGYIHECMDEAAA